MTTKIVTGKERFTLVIREIEAQGLHMRLPLIAAVFGLDEYLVQISVLDQPDADPITQETDVMKGEHGLSKWDHAFIIGNLAVPASIKLELFTRKWARKQRLIGYSDLTLTSSGDTTQTTILDVMVDGHIVPSYHLKVAYQLQIVARDIEVKTTSSPLPRVSADEAVSYYAGLPSRPVLVARTGSTPYTAPSGPGAYPKFKELRIVGTHAIQDVWEDGLASTVHTILGRKGVNWTSTDVVRIGYVEESTSPVILWIGVKPGSLSYDDGIDAALQCKGVLSKHGINDVDVEIRESELIHSDGPKLLMPTLDSDPTAGYRKPFTPTLGMPICSQVTAGVEGTAGFFLNEGGDGKRLFLVTARHVVFPPTGTAENNDHYYYCNPESQCRHDILILSDASFQEHLGSIQKKIEIVRATIGIQNKRIQNMEGRNDDSAKKEREQAEDMRNRMVESVDALTALGSELLKDWGTKQSRILGHVLFSPPITYGAGDDQYTQDMAVIAIDDSKIDPSSFAGNVIDLGKFSPEKLIRMMPPNFEYPSNRLLSLRGIITDQELRNPTMYDKDRDVNCIIVLKHGKASDLTVGRANNITSYTHFGYDKISKQWSILPFDRQSGSFSERGDSGSVVVDYTGRIGGILTCGSGIKDSLDVTYATPVEFILKTIRSCRELAEADPWEGPAPW